MHADPDSTIEQFTTSRPWAVPLLVKLQFFCRTDRTLAQACADAEIGFDELLALVEAERPREERSR